jgi:hypothetical protein
MIIEMCDDIIRVSHGFDGCQILEYIADIQNLRIEDSDAKKASKE